MDMIAIKDNRSKYRDICIQHPEIPIFLQAWWMDASCKENWNVLFSRNSSGFINGFLCFHIKSRLGFHAILPQMLTPFQGLWVFCPDDLKDDHRVKYESAVISDLISQIKELNVGLYEQALHYRFNNIGIFANHKINVVSKVIHRLEPIPPIENIIAGLPDRKRRLLMSKKYAGLSVKIGMNPKVFYNLYCDELRERGKKIYYSSDYFINLYTAAKNHNQGEIIYMQDAMNNIHAALWLVWDSTSIYTLILFINNKFRNSGASLGVIIEAIKYKGVDCKVLDFAGSSIPSVASRNIMFGAVPFQHFVISKITNPLLKLWYWTKH